ncbi:MAG: hypothetical protein ACHQDB_10810 [Steroidobacterales bacterium]
MPLSLTRTLRLKVRAEAYSWVNAAAVEVNEVFNYCNETSLAKSVLDSGWGLLKNFLEYKSGSLLAFEVSTGNHPS